MVAAAGNDGKSDPFYPAAFSTHPDFGSRVVSVGALEPVGEDGRRLPASFSNHGPWVNAWGPGVRVRSDYASSVDFVYPDRSTRRFEGGAAWSGTSFAAPYVAAAIIREADRTGASAPEAWTRIRAGRPFGVFD